MKQLKRVFELTNATLSSEFVSINFAINRVVGEDILCVKNLPAFDNSAMDGFCFKASDAGQTLKNKKSYFAGDKDKVVMSYLKKWVLQNKWQVQKGTKRYRYYYYYWKLYKCYRR